MSDEAKEELVYLEHDGVAAVLPVTNGGIVIKTQREQLFEPTNVGVVLHDGEKVVGVSQIVGLDLEDKPSQDTNTTNEGEVIGTPRDFPIGESRYFGIESDQDLLQGIELDEFERMALPEMVYGKTVAVIGGASEAQDVSGYDCIVTINNHHATKDLTPHIIFTAGAEMIDEKNTERLGCVYADRRGQKTRHIKKWCLEYDVAFFEFDTKKKGVHTPGEKWAQNLINRYDCKPFTGVFAVAALASLTEPKELFITGMDFYSNGGEVVPEKRHSHAVQANRQMLRHFIHHYSYVIADEALQRSLELPVQEPEELNAILDNMQLDRTALQEQEAGNEPDASSDS